MRHHTTETASDIVLLSTSVIAAAQALPAVTAFYYGAPNIAAGTILHYSLALPVTPLPAGGFSVDLSGLFAQLTNVEKPDGLSDTMSRLFDDALDHPVIKLVGLTDGMTVTNGPWG